MFYEDISVGQSAEFAKVVSEADIQSFAEISGDHNPVHLDEAFARATPFQGRIAHGLLSAAFISAVFGMNLPGPGCVYVAQSLRFKGPVRIGDRVTARVEVTALVPEKKFVTFRTTCSVGPKVVIDGEATLMVPSRD